jgi:hypothetical protein
VRRAFEDLQEKEVRRDHKVLVAVLDQVAHEVLKVLVHREIKVPAV